MAINIGQPLCNTTDGYLCEGKDIKGGYFVIDQTTNISKRIAEKGSLCYVTGTSSAPINKFYQHDGNDWVEANLGGSSSGGEVTVGSTIAGFTVGDKHLTNKYTHTNDTINLDYYMTAPDTFNLGNPLYMTDAKSEFSYVGTDGIGTMKFTSLDGHHNANHVVLNSYMSAGKLVSNNVEITGGTISGNTSFRNEYTLSNNSKLYMSSYNTLNRASISLGSTSLDDIRDYTYVGADGIGTYHINAMTSGNISSTSRTYMTAGQLVSNDVNITGGTITGGTIRGSTKFRTEYNMSSDADIDKLYMTDYKTLRRTTSLFDSYFVDKENSKDYVYVGTDGIGTYRIDAMSYGNISSSSKTYMAAGQLVSNNVNITGGTINNCTIGGSTKVGIAYGGTGSTTAAGGAINLLKELSNVKYATKTVTIPWQNISNNGSMTTGSISATIDGLILNVSTSTSNCTVSAKNNSSTGKATYTVNYNKIESQTEASDVSATIHILSIPDII